MKRLDRVPKSVPAPYGDVVRKGGAEDEDVKNLMRCALFVVDDEEASCSDAVSTGPFETKPSNPARNKLTMRSNFPGRRRSGTLAT